MIRNNENENCPSNDYQQGKPSGQCWGDGHYLCFECKHYRADFKKHGLDYVSAAHNPHSGIVISELTKVEKHEPCCRDGWDCYFFYHGKCPNGHKPEAQ